MPLIHEGKGTAARPRDAAPSIATHSIENDRGAHYSAEADRLQALRLQLARHGLSLSTTDGADFLLTGPGTCLLADPRSAWLFLRSLNRGHA